MEDVGGGVGDLLRRERPLEPVAHPGALLQADAEEVAHELGQRRRPEAEEAGGDLGVEHPGGDGSRGPEQHLEVLLAGVGHHQAVAVEHRAQRADVDQGGVDDRGASRGGDLEHGEAGVVRRLAVELGVEPVGLGARQLVDQGGKGIVCGDEHRPLSSAPAGATALTQRLEWLDEPKPWQSGWMGRYRTPAYLIDPVYAGLAVVIAFVGVLSTLAGAAAAAAAMQLRPVSSAW